MTLFSANVRSGFQESAVADPETLKRGTGAENMKYKLPCLADIFFVTIVSGEGPSCPPGSATGWYPCSNLAEANRITFADSHL